MHIKPSNLIYNKKAVSNIISAILLMFIFISIIMSVFSFSIPILGKIIEANELQRAKNVLYSINKLINLNRDTSFEFTLYDGYINLENHSIEISLINNSNGSIEEKINLNSPMLYYTEPPYPSISYEPSVKLLNYGRNLYIVMKEISYDVFPSQGFHKIVFSTYSENKIYVGNYTICINYSDYNRSRCYFNINKLGLNIEKIEMSDKEWRG